MSVLRSLVGLMAGLVVVGFPFLALSYHDGAPSGFSGPEQVCNACHYNVDYPTPANSGTGAIAITAPGTFVPGEPITITVDVTNTTAPDPSNHTGFEVSVRTGATNTHVGRFVVDDVLVKHTTGDTSYVTHTTASNTGHTWSFSWVPPATAAPDFVTIHAAGNAANGNDETSGDFIYTTSRVVERSTVAAEAGPVAGGLRLGPVSPNPVRGAAAVALTLDRPARVVARVLDLQGREVRRVAEGQWAAGASLLRVETPGLAAGRYVLDVTADGAHVTRALTVAR